MITLYHGTDKDSARSICQNGIDFSIDNSSNDFGAGFYTTPDRETAIKRAKKKALWRNTKAAIVVVVFDDVYADTIIKKFQDDCQWAQFIMNNRNGLRYTKMVSSFEHNLDKKYDITYGRIADIDVVNFSNKLLNENRKIKESELYKILNTSYAMQYAFHSSRCLEFVKRMYYKEVD